MLIIISGFAGSGKSSLAESIGEELGLKAVHASSILRQMSTQGLEALKDASPKRIKDWWESKEAKEFMRKRQEDGSLDKALDKKLLEIAKKGNVVLDSWTMPYLYKGKAFRVWLSASPENRAKRVASRDSQDYKQVLAKIMARDRETKHLYERLYNFKMGESLKVFDLVLDTNSLSQEQVFRKVLAEFRKRE